MCNEKRFGAEEISRRPLAGLPFAPLPQFVVVSFRRPPSTSPRSFAFLRTPFSKHVLSLKPCNKAPFVPCLHGSCYSDHDSSFSDSSLHLHLSPDKSRTFCGQVRAKPPVLHNHAHQTQENSSRLTVFFFCSLTRIHQTSRLPYVYHHPPRPIVAAYYQHA